LVSIAKGHRRFAYFVSGSAKCGDAPRANQVRN
jgi:hypothetical protein